MITILFQIVRFFVVPSGPVLIPIQILEINSVLFINRTPRTGSGSYTVRLSFILRLTEISSEPTV